mgnify:CR=1 FL=1
MADSVFPFGQAHPGRLNPALACAPPRPRPAPQYPLYSASIQLYGGTLLPYSLKEESGWSMDLNEITRSVHDARWVPPMDGWVGGAAGLDGCLLLRPPGAGTAAESACR